MELKDRLKTAREKAGLTQEDLADKCGLSRGAIANYECGDRIPKNKILNDICAVLNVTQDWLLGTPRKSMVDELLERLIADGTITSTELDETTRSIILKIVEAEILQKLKNN